MAGVLTLVIRLALHTSGFDLFGDEVIYTDLGRSVVHGGFPRYGGPFFLHGPGFFYLEAGWAHLLGSQHSLIGWIYEMRALNALVAAATAVVVVLLAARTTSLWAGAVAGLLFALDPFSIRQNDRVLLETALMLLVLLGYLIFLSLIGRSPPRRGWPRAVGAGLLFGCAVLTKDEGALLTLLPLLAAAVFRWGPRLRLILITIGATVAVYVAYVVVVIANGYFGLFWQAKTSGIQRLLGLIQSTGFNSGGGGPLSSRLLTEANYFGTSYVVLALALPAVVLVLLRGGQLTRMLGLLYCVAGVTLGYALVFGTLEEQELYLLMVTSLLILPVGAAVLLGRCRRAVRSLRHSRRSIMRTRRWMPLGAALIGALTLVVAINLVTSVQWLRQPDDGWALLLRYLQTRVPAGTLLGATDDDIEAEYALSNSYHLDVLTSLSAPSREHVRYIVIEWSQVNEGYANLTTSQVRHMVRHDGVVFSFHGRTYGDLALYRTPTSEGSTS